MAPTCGHHNNSQFGINHLSFYGEVVHSSEVKMYTYDREWISKCVFEVSFIRGFTMMSQADRLCCKAMLEKQNNCQNASLQLPLSIPRQLTTPQQNTTLHNYHTAYVCCTHMPGTSTDLGMHNTQPVGRFKNSKSRNPQQHSDIKSCF